MAKCEAKPGGMIDLVCEMPTNLQVAIGDCTPMNMCLAHITLELQHMSLFPWDVFTQSAKQFGGIKVKVIE